MRENELVGDAKISPVVSVLTGPILALNLDEVRALAEYVDEDDPETPGGIGDLARKILRDLRGEPS